MRFKSDIALQQTPLEDPLAYLPRSTVVEFKKGQIIYGHDRPCEHLYLVLSGTVQVMRLADQGIRLLLDLYREDELFGEASLLHLYDTAEQAMSNESTTLMSWGAVEVEEIALDRPQLAVALLQVLGLRAQSSTRRIESLSFERSTAVWHDPWSGSVSVWVRRSPDGSVMMQSLTHELLGQYVGTSREVVTFHMTNLRRLGYLKYSRKAILVYRDALKAWLDERAPS